LIIFMCHPPFTAKKRHKNPQQQNTLTAGDLIFGHTHKRHTPTDACHLSCYVNI
jgi:hypothetical protein